MHTLMLRLVALALLLAGAPIRDTATDFHWKGTVAAGQSVEIKNVNGEIDASAAAGNEVEVEAHKSARHSDPGSVQIKVVEHGGGVTVCAVYPGRYGRSNECGAGDAGHMDNDNNDVDVRFTVRVPAGVNFVARTVNGGVRATELEGDVKATTVNGGVKISGSGIASAETVNGSIEAEMGRSGNEDLSFKTVNGSITVRVPADLSAEVRAETLNGSIETDLPGLTMSHRIHQRLSGTVGHGGAHLSATTLNGSVHLLSH